MTDSPLQEDWVNLTEACEITGYDREYMKKMVSRMWKQPEDDRAIKIRRRSNGYEVWLPDLIAYSDKRRRRSKPQPNSN